MKNNFLTAEGIEIFSKAMRSRVLT